MRAFFIATLAAVCIARAAAQAVPASAKASAPADLTGYWVAFVTEDWRFRMITPRKGDYQAVPMTDQARKVADAWNPEADEAAGNQCKAYGAAAIMRVAARFHITWQETITRCASTATPACRRASSISTRSPRRQANAPGKASPPHSGKDRR